MCGHYLCVLALCTSVYAGDTVVDASSLRGRIMAGYQGWFRCPGDAANMGWIHWSRDPNRIAPDTLTFEMWPDVSEYPKDALCEAPGFRHPDGTQAYLFTSDHPEVVLKHFEWMRDYGIDGAWLQEFAVDLPGGPLDDRHPSQRRVLEHVRAAAGATGRVWAISFDIAGMAPEATFEVVTRYWRDLVDQGITSDDRYLHEGDLPVVQIWGFYRNNASNHMTPELGNRLIDFFTARGPYRAFLVGGGDWNWRQHPDPAWQAMVRRFGAYCPWNIGNYSLGEGGVQSASVHYWAEDKAVCEANGTLWIPTIYPGFSWDNLTQQPPGTSLIARRGGEFLWEQFVALYRLHCDTVYLAMFDEVDEGTALFKVTSEPPVEAHFVGYDGLPNDWYLRVVREGIAMLRGHRPFSESIPIAP